MHNRLPAPQFIGAECTVATIFIDFVNPLPVSVQSGDLLRVPAGEMLTSFMIRTDTSGPLKTTHPPAWGGGTYIHLSEMLHHRDVIYRFLGDITLQ